MSVKAASLLTHALKRSIEDYGNDFYEGLCLSVSLSVCVWLAEWLSLCLCLSLSITVFLCLYLSLSLSVCLSVCLSVSLALIKFNRYSRLTVLIGGISTHCHIKNYTLAAREI